MGNLHAPSNLKIYFILAMYLICYEFHTQIVKIYIKPHADLLFCLQIHGRRLSVLAEKLGGSHIKSDEQEFCKI